jgi:hypothetical protein
VAVADCAVVRSRERAVGEHVHGGVRPDAVTDGLNERYIVGAALGRGRELVERCELAGLPSATTS